MPPVAADSLTPYQLPFPRDASTEIVLPNAGHGLLNGRRRFLELI